MTNRTTEEIARGLTELAERVERASGPDRALDVAVAVAVDWRWPEWEEGESTARGMAERNGLDWLVDRTINGMASMWRHMPAFTASLDAAMTLAEGFGGQVTFFKDGTAKAFLWQPYPMAVEVKAATPALALCAAALRALAVRSHLEGDKP